MMSGHIGAPFTTSTRNGRMLLYPDDTQARDRFILERRAAKPRHDPWRNQGVTIEDEVTADGIVARVATVFLTGRECPWRCLMCDLWQFTTDASTPVGALAAQAAEARRTIEARGGATHMKLYNAGSFFDPRAVPESDYDAIARSTAGFERVIVECHPSLVGARVARWMDAMARHAVGGVPAFEVAMGLETAHPGALDRLNKRMTLDGFARAGDRLMGMGVALRVFLLVAPPFVPLLEHGAWLLRSIDFAWRCGAAVVSLIPTRTGNGALDAIAADGSFRSPTIHDLERSLESALSAPRPAGARVFADTWDLDRFATCPDCLAARRARVHAMNLQQAIEPRIVCAACTPALQ